MPSTEGNCSASLRPGVGPSPGVRASASQYKDCEIPGLVPDMKTCLAEGCKLRGLYTDCGKSVKSSKAAGEGACAPQAGSSISACYNAFMRRLRISAISFLITAHLMGVFDKDETAKDLHIK